MKHIRRLHARLRGKYPWYDTWHNHPRHELFHWIIFAFLAAFTTTAVFLNTRSGLSETRRLEKARAETPASSGNISGRIPDQILVAFEPNFGQSKKNAVLARHGLKEKLNIEGAGVDLVRIPPNKTPEGAVQELNNEDGVDFAEVDALLSPSLTPNDPDYANEWHQPKINSPAAWDLATGAGVTIAIIDTGVDLSHPDLMSNLVPGWNFYDGNADASDVYGHGTEVAGAAAASGNNNIEIAGAAYNAKIMPLRVGSPAGYASYSAIANAITYAADHGAKIANVSYQAGGSRTVQRAAKYMKGKGGLTVVAEGNTGTDSGYKNSPDIISVSATDNYDTAASWSSYGSDVDVSAPGQAIFTTKMGGGTDYFSGTSFSAPIVSGVLALIWSENPGLTPDQAQTIIFNSATNLGPSGWDPHYGWGRIDAGQAISLSRP